MFDLMINIKIYKNGYEIMGHTQPDICSEVSFLHWITSNLVIGWDRSQDVKEYSSSRDNKENPNEGYSYLAFNYHDNDIDWIFEDFVVSLQKMV